LSSTVYEADNKVYANITSFSPFGMFGEPVVDSPPVVTLIGVNYTIINSSTVNASFYYNVSDDVGLINCSLWGNWSGGWHLNQTDPAPTNNDQNIFSGVILPEGSFDWNVVCYDTLGQAGSFTGGNSTLTVTAGSPEGPSMIITVSSAAGFTGLTTILLFTASLVVLYALAKK